MTAPTGTSPAASAMRASSRARDMKVRSKGFNNDRRNHPSQARPRHYRHSVRASTRGRPCGPSLDPGIVRIRAEAARSKRPRSIARAPRAASISILPGAGRWPDSPHPSHPCARRPARDKTRIESPRPSANKEIPCAPQDTFARSHCC
jgi:hypothetical protein